MITELKNAFLDSKMNMDVDSRLMPEGQYRYALNFRISKSEDQDAGAGENSLSNRRLTNFNFGDNAECIGMYGNEFDDKVYWFVKSDSGSYLLEWNNINETFMVVLEDTRVGSANVLNLSKDFIITGVNMIIDSDRGANFLLWTDGLNPPRMINVERAKTYGANGFDSDMISVYKSPPFSAPTLELKDTDTDQENNLEEKFLSFSYRYKYLDGEYSALAPFSEYAFEPKLFMYDYSLSSNESMVNRYSAVDIEFNTGSKLVTDIELVFKESNSSSVYVIESFNKLSKGWGDDQLVKFLYSNSKIEKVLSEKELSRLYDNVPLKAFAQDLLGNRVMYAQYTENIDIADCDGNKINVVLDADYKSEPVLTGTPVRTVKSNRDYELAISYIYGGGRMTTPITSEGNTIFVPNKDSINKNTLKLAINSLAPCKAEAYRVFIKQSKTEYETIVPTLFYQDGVYVWIRLDGSEKSKVDVGDFLLVKSDSSSILDSVKQTKVLEIEDKPKNFLEETTVPETKQLSGTYMKIKPVGFRISEEDFFHFEFLSHDTSGNNYDNPIRNNISYIENPVFYGEGLDDLTSSGTFTSINDVRYWIEIDGASTFKWSKNEGQTFEATGVTITTSDQDLDNGVKIKFASSVGHNIGDRWAVGGKSKTDRDYTYYFRTKTYTFWKGINEGTGGNKDTIEGGAVITLSHQEYGRGSERIDESFVATRRYANLEEWWIGDDIGSKISIDADRIWFRRGDITFYRGNATYMTINPNAQMNIVVRSKATQSSNIGKQVKAKTSVSIFQSENDIIFETKPLDSSLDIFHELGTTYKISNDRYHLGHFSGDISQTSGNGAVLEIPFFNCYGWGNGFESYKIKDLLTGKALGIDTRPSISFKDYAENHRIASITYSGVYEQSSNYNAINEFNLSQANYKDVDDKYGAIKKIFGRDNNLLVMQEDKISQVLFNKSILYNADGTGNVSQNLEVLGEIVPYVGEFGISNNPESFAILGNNVFFTDAKRGAVMRLGNNGLTKISSYGMSDWFRDDFREFQDAKKVGCYDPYFDQYTLSSKTPEIIPINEVSCGSGIMRASQLGPYSYILKLNKLSGDIIFNYDVSLGLVDITATFNGTVYDFPLLSGFGSVSFLRDSLVEDEVYITITPRELSDYTLIHRCPSGI